MNLKKLPQKIALYLLTSGASLILGFLSFGGMFALWPILPLAFTAFVLSVAYEGEIYLQNITGAWNKLFKFKHLERQLAKQFLSENIPDTEGRPEFFNDYDRQLRHVRAFDAEPLTPNNKALKKHAEKTLADMEKWFSLRLFPETTHSQSKSQYAKDVTTWIKQHEKYQEVSAKKDIDIKNTWWMQGFSALAGIFMSVGTSYLLVEAFSAIPFFTTIAFATWPLFIVPMAAIAGVAYGLLTYNTITDMYNNKTLIKWRDNLLKEGLTRKTVLAYSLVTLALVLTVCTAGTWWTVIKETRPLFGWMEKLPRVIMGVINPVITGLSAVIFNLENTHQSLEWMMPTTTKKMGPDHHHSEHLEISKKTGSDHHHHHRHAATKKPIKPENLVQYFNPFRIILMLTITPLRLVLFAGHLISIGVTADRLPGVSTLFSALVGIISECFEDFHYFFSHGEIFKDFNYFLHQLQDKGHQNVSACNHHHGQDPTIQELRDDRLKKGHGHDHSRDIPTWIIKGLFTPVYFLAALWDWGFQSKNDRHNLTESMKKMGFKIEEETNTEGHETIKPPSYSDGWMLAHAIQRIQRHKEKHSGDTLDSLNKLEGSLCNIGDPSLINLSEKITAAGQSRQNGFFKTTQQFLKKDLPTRINLPGHRVGC